VEGEDLLDAALRQGIRPLAIVVDEERVPPDDPLLEATDGVDECYRAPTALIAGASGLAAPPRVLAILPWPAAPSFADVTMPPSLALYLAGVADPGNVGTLVRTCAGLGGDWIALGPGSADPFQPKALRAAMGATFSLPILQRVTAEDLSTRAGLRVVAAVAAGGAPPWEADLASPCLVALGAERDGLEGVLDALAAAVPVERLTIPQAPGTDSLNVAAAGAAVMAEAVRQRAVAAAGAPAPPVGQ
jgi:TrmH family RNA methyltransferase